MGKWEEGVEYARKSKKRTWLTKRGCPLGKEISMNDPIRILPEIGDNCGIYLNECEIFYVCNAVNHSEYLNNLLASKAVTMAIKRIVRDGLAGKINKGTCPSKYGQVDHRKCDNPYESRW